MPTNGYPGSETRPNGDSATSSTRPSIRFATAKSRNPEILHKEGKIEHEEGCLSVPDYYETVTRAERIRVRALTRDGEVLEQDFDELMAICIQHEMDHLEGKLFVDYLSTPKQQKARKVVQKWEKEQAKLAEKRAAAAKAIIA